jgi:hypothetical protein
MFCVAALTILSGKSLVHLQTSSIGPALNFEHHSQKAFGFAGKFEFICELELILDKMGCYA